MVFLFNWLIFGLHVKFEGGNWPDWKTGLAFFLLSNNLGTSRMVVIQNLCAIYERNP